MVRRGLLLGGLSLALALPPLAAAVGLDYVVGIAARILIFALAGVSLNLILGYGGMVSFGHAAFFGTGAYVVAILGHHASAGDALVTWPFTIGGSDLAVIAWPMAMLVCGVLALVIGAICLRTSGLYFIMITLAFAQMLYFFFVALEPYGGDDGLSLAHPSRAWPIDLSDDRQFYYLVLALLLVILYLMRRLIASRFGLVLRGIRENERRMQAMGFATYRYKLAAFVISGAVAGLAGALIANHTEFVSPSFLDWRRSGEILVVVILGGMGTLYGPVAGAIAYLMLEEVLARWTEHWMIILGPLLVLVVLYAKQGLWGAVEKLSARR